MKGLTEYINESIISGTFDQFYEVLSEILVNYADEDTWWKKVKQHFKKNKSIYKAIAYYSKWRDLLGINDDIDKIYSTKQGRNRIEKDVKKYDKELSEKLLSEI